MSDENRMHEDVQDEINEELQEEQPAKNGKKKLIAIIAGIIIALLAIAGLVFGIRTGFDPENVKSILEQDFTGEGPIELKLKKPDDVVVVGLKDTYEKGEKVEFTVSTTDEYDEIYKVRINGIKVTPDENGRYTGTVTNRIYVKIESKVVYGDAVITVEESDKYLSYEGMKLNFFMENEDGEIISEASGTVKNGKITLKKLKLGTWEIKPISFMGGELKFASITLEERENEVTTKRSVGVNNKIGKATAAIDVGTSSVYFTNSKTEGLRQEGYFFIQNQNLEGEVWFGAKIKMCEEDLKTPDYPFVALAMYEDGWNLIQVMGNSDGTAAVKYNYDNTTAKKLDDAWAEALTKDGILIAACRTEDGKVKIYGGIRADEMNLWVTYDKPNMKRHSLDQFGFLTQGKLKNSSIEYIKSGKTMEEVISGHGSFGMGNENVTIIPETTSDNLSFEGVKFTFTLKRNDSVEYTGKVKDGKIKLSNIPTGIYEVSGVDLFGGELNFKDILVINDGKDIILRQVQGINDQLKSDDVTIDVKTSSAHVEDAKDVSGYVMLQHQELEGDVWFGMKMQMSEEDLNATDYRNIGINIYKDASHRIQLVSIGGNRAILKYDDDTYKELTGDMAKLIAAQGIYVAVNRTESGKLKVYGGVQPNDMEHWFTVDSTKLGDKTIDQIGFEMKGPMNEAHLWNLKSGSSMKKVLGSNTWASDATVDVTAKITSTSDKLNFEGVELTLTNKLTKKTYKATVKDGKLAFGKLPVGTYNVSSVDFFGGELSFGDVILWEGRTGEIEITHTNGINDTIVKDGVTVNVADSSAIVENYEETASKNLFLKHQNLTGEVYLGMKVHMSAEDLAETDYRNIGINIYKDGSNRIQVLSLGNGRAAVKYDNDHVVELSADMAQLLAADGIYVSAHRTADGKLEVYAGALPGSMELLFTVDKPNMGTKDLDQIGLDLQGPLVDASITNLSGGKTMADAVGTETWDSETKQDVTVTLKSTSSRLDFAGVKVTVTDANGTAYTSYAAGAYGKVTFTDLPLGVYEVADIPLLGGALTFDDMLIWEGRTAVDLQHANGINDGITETGVTVNVSSSGATAENYKGESKSLLLKHQSLTGDVWLAMTAQMSEEDLKATGWPNIGLNIYKNGSNRIQIISLGSGRAAVKYDNNNQKELRLDLVTALKAGNLLVAAHRTSEGKLEVFAGAEAGKMERLFTVESPAMGADALDQIGLDLQGPLTNASLTNVVSGATAEDVIEGFTLTTDRIITVKSNSDNMSFEGVKFTLTSTEDATKKYEGTVNASGKVNVGELPVGTYAIADIPFFGGTLTFNNIEIKEGVTEYTINQNEGINDTIGENAKSKISVVNSSVEFKNSNASNDRSDGYWFLQGQKLSGNVWFGMNVKMSSDDLKASGNPYVGLVIWKNPSKPTDGWNFVQVMSKGNENQAVVKFNNGNDYVLKDELVTALTGDGLLIAVNRTAEGELLIYGGAKADSMKFMKKIASTNMGAADLDQFGTITGGSIQDASIENVKSGISAEAVLGDEFALVQDVTVNVQVKDTNNNAITGVSFEDVELELKTEAGAAYTPAGGSTIDGNNQLTIKNMPLGKYTVSSIDFLGGKLTFDGIEVEENTTAISLTAKEQIEIQKTDFTISVKDSSVRLNEGGISGNRIKVFLKDQSIAANAEAWFGMTVKMSEADVSATDYRNVGFQIFNKDGGADYIQVLNNQGKGIVIKHDPCVKGGKTTQMALDEDMISALKKGELLLAINRTTTGSLKVYAGTEAAEMKFLFEVSADKATIDKEKIVKFGTRMDVGNGNKVEDASISGITTGNTATAVIKDFSLVQDVTFTVAKGNVPFTNVGLTLTSGSNEYKVTTDASGKATVDGMKLGTYTVSSVGFLDGQLTFDPIEVEEGTTAVTLEPKEVTVQFSDGVSASATGITFKGNLTGDFKTNYLYYKKATALSGNAWFGMKVKMSEADLNNNSKPWIGFLIWENPNKPSDGWNFVRVESQGNSSAKIYFNKSQVICDSVPTELIAALQGDGMYLAINRVGDEANTLKVYGGPSPSTMQYLGLVNDSSSTKTNVKNADIDEYGVVAQGNISSASIEDIKGGTSGAAVLGDDFTITSDVAVTFDDRENATENPNKHLDFSDVSLTFTLKGTESAKTPVTYTGTIGADGKLYNGSTAVTFENMPVGTYAVTPVTFLGGTLPFTEITVTESTTETTTTYDQTYINDKIPTDKGTVTVKVATSSVYVTDYTNTTRDSGAFYLENQTIKGDVWFDMRVKMSADDMKNSGGYQYIAWNSFVASGDGNWNFVQVMNNKGNQIGVVKYNNNYATALNSDLASALTGENGMYLVLHRTGKTMDVYASADQVLSSEEKLFTINATASAGKPALNLQDYVLENFGFLVQAETKASIKSASIENMRSAADITDLGYTFEESQSVMSLSLDDEEDTTTTDGSTITVTDGTTEISLKDMQVTFTLQSDESGEPVSYTGVVGEDGKVSIPGGMKAGTYTVTLTYTIPDVEIPEGTKTIAILPNKITGKLEIDCSGDDDSSGDGDSGDGDSDDGGSDGDNNSDGGSSDAGTGNSTGGSSSDNGTGDSGDGTTSTPETTESGNGTTPTTPETTGDNSGDGDGTTPATPANTGDETPSTGDTTPAAGDEPTE